MTLSSCESTVQLGATPLIASFIYCVFFNDVYLSQLNKDKRSEGESRDISDLCALLIVAMFYRVYGRCLLYLAKSKMREKQRYFRPGILLLKTLKF